MTINFKMKQSPMRTWKPKKDECLTNSKDEIITFSSPFPKPLFQQHHQSLRCPVLQPQPPRLKMLPLFNTPRAVSPRSTHFQELPFSSIKAVESSHHHSLTPSTTYLHLVPCHLTLCLSVYTLAMFQIYHALKPLHMLLQ